MLSGATFFAISSTLIESITDYERREVAEHSSAIVVTAVNSILLAT
jgi:hypothetical protein